jgi:hypothetical protein
MGIEIDPVTGAPIIKSDDKPFTVTSPTGDLPKPQSGKENDGVADALDELQSKIDDENKESHVLGSDIEKTLEVPVVEETSEPGSMRYHTKLEFERKLGRIESIIRRGMDNQQVKHAMRDIKTVLSE